MPKPVALTPDALTPSNSQPSAATPPRRPTAEAQPEEKTVPMQFRIPISKARAIKLAATERDMSCSDFMLTCFDAFMQTSKASK